MVRKTLLKKHNNQKTKKKETLIKKIFLKQITEYKTCPSLKYIDIFLLIWYLMGILFSTLNIFVLTLVLLGFRFQENIAPKFNDKIYFALIFILGFILQIYLKSPG